MAGAFISQLAISRIEVYNKILTEKNPEAKKYLERYYIVTGQLIEKFLENVKGQIEIEVPVPITARSNVEYFRRLLFTLRAEYPEETRGHIDLIRAEILGLVASTRQNLENLIV
jgi:hypothetical protein